MQQARYIAVIKAKPSGPIAYYGPFVSETKANHCLEETPPVDPGGFKTIRTLQTFSRH